VYNLLGYKLACLILLSSIAFGLNAQNTIPVYFSDSASYKKAVQNVLQQCDDDGYPFAYLVADSVHKDANNWNVRYAIVKGIKFTWDTVTILGDVAIKPKWLSIMLHTKNGDTYSGKTLTKAKQYLSSLPFVTVTADPKAKFAGVEAFPIISLKKRASNQADGILGVLPNQQQAGKILINGEVNLLLNNLFHSGKMLQLQWKSISNANQKIDVQYKHPAIGSMPIEITTAFSLLRQDSTFLSRQARIDVSYIYVGGSKLGFYINNQNSTLIGNTERRDSNLLASTSYTQYGLSASFNKLNDYFYPKQGIKGSMELAVGNKELINARSVQKGPSTTLQFQAKLNFEGYLPIKKRQVIMLRFHGQGLFNNNLQVNELLRVGGLASMRGFNENTFFAAQYAVSTIEYRFFTESTTYLSLFVDQGLVRYQTFLGKNLDTPTGIGVGASFAVASGIFNLTYTLGRQKSSSFEFQNAKIHFGLIARF
jgi:outer membrane protein assembly factor BamA